MATPFADYLVFGDLPLLATGQSKSFDFNVPTDVPALQVHGGERPILFFMINASGNADVTYDIKINSKSILPSPWTFKSPQPQGLGVGYWVPFDANAHDPVDKQKIHINPGNNTLEFDVTNGPGKILFQNVFLMFQRV